MQAVDATFIAHTDTAHFLGPLPRMNARMDRDGRLGDFLLVILRRFFRVWRFHAIASRPIIAEAWTSF